MKTLIFSCAVLAVFSDAASAQSSVTLYGVVDDGVNYVSNAGGARQYNVTSGVSQGSRWGLLGAEDLGGGLKAVFRLENGFDINSGKNSEGGLGLGRQSYVGLSSSSYGTVTAGRQYDSVADNVGFFGGAIEWGGYIVAHPADNDNIDWDNRVNNAVKYLSPNYSGFTFGGLYSLGGVAGSVTRNQIWSAGFQYGHGPFTMGVGYLNVRNPNVSFYGTGVAANTTGGNLAVLNNFTASPVVSGLASANTQQVVAVGAAYKLGVATISGNYSNVKYESLGGPVGVLNPAGLTGTVTLNNAEVDLQYLLTPALKLASAFEYTTGSDIHDGSGPKYIQAALGANYFLSKSTDVYMVGVYQKASGTDSTGKAARASISGLTPSSGDRQAIVRIGIRHNF